MIDASCPRAGFSFEATPRLYTVDAAQPRAGRSDHRNNALAKQLSETSQPPALVVKAMDGDATRRAALEETVEGLLKFHKLQPQKQVLLRLVQGGILEEAASKIASAASSSAKWPGCQGTQASRPPHGVLLPGSAPRYSSGDGGDRYIRLREIGGVRDPSVAVRQTLRLF